MYDRVKETKKKKKREKVERPNKWFCFMVGKENPSLWLHYQIMICIFTAEMNNNKRNVGEICGTQASGCHGDVAAPRLLAVKMQNMSTSPAEM